MICNDEIISSSPTNVSASTSNLYFPVLLVNVVLQADAPRWVAGRRWPPRNVHGLFHRVVVSDRYKCDSRTAGELGDGALRGRA